jgi:hypothetical protein
MNKPAQIRNNQNGELTPIDVRLERRRLVTPAGCWEWQGCRTPNGYGHVTVGSVRDGSRRVRNVHAVAYECWVGEVPEGKELDHLCRNPSCFNPDHLEPVTHSVNLKRAYPMGEAFKCGHTRTEDNISLDGSKFRRCKTCMQAKRRARYERDKAKA